MPYAATHCKRSAARSTLVTSQLSETQRSSSKSDSACGWIWQAWLISVRLGMAAQGEVGSRVRGEILAGYLPAGVVSAMLGSSKEVNPFLAGRLLHRLIPHLHKRLPACLNN